MAENLNEYFSLDISIYFQYLRLSSKGESLTI